MKRIAKDDKLNYVLNDILDSLLTIHDTEEESREEVSHYVSSFPREIDHNIVMYGEVEFEYHKITEIYRKAGYPEQTTNSDLLCWELYKKHVGYMAVIVDRGEDKDFEDINE